MRLEVSDVHKAYGDTPALAGASLELDGGDGDGDTALALIGPSGGGKSTLLRLAGGLESPDRGTLSVGGTRLGRDTARADLLAHRRRNGFLFQSYNLFPHLDALANITLPLTKVHGMPGTVAQRRAREALDRFGLADLARRRPAELSGGQQQRAALARAIAHQPDLLILDEPTSALDPEMTAEVLDLILELRRSGQQLLISTHEIGFAREAASHVAFVAGGAVPAYGPARDLLGRPEHPALRQFLSKVTRFA